MDKQFFTAHLIISCRLSQAGRLFLTAMNSLSSPLSCIKKISVLCIRIRWIRVGSSSGSGSRSLLFIKDLKNFLKKKFNLKFLNRSVLVIPTRNRIRMFLGLPDPDPFVRGMDPDPAPSPSLFPWMCWADWNNAWQNRILTHNFSKKLNF